MCENVTTRNISYHLDLSYSSLKWNEIKYIRWYLEWENINIDRIIATTELNNNSFNKWVSEQQLCAHQLPDELYIIQRDPNTNTTLSLSPFRPQSRETKMRKTRGLDITSLKCAIFVQINVSFKEIQKL